MSKIQKGLDLSVTLAHLLPMVFYSNLLLFIVARCETYPKDKTHITDHQYKLTGSKVGLHEWATEVGLSCERAKGATGLAGWYVWKEEA